MTKNRELGVEVVNRVKHLPAFAVIFITDLTHYQSRRAEKTTPTNIPAPEHSFYTRKYIKKKKLIYGNKSNKRIDTLLYS